jgi:hypothetical protein
MLVPRLCDGGWEATVLPSISASSLQKISMLLRQVQTIMFKTRLAESMEMTREILAYLPPATEPGLVHKCLLSRCGLVVLMPWWMVVDFSDASKEDLSLMFESYTRRSLRSMSTLMFSGPWMPLSRLERKFARSSGIPYPRMCEASAVFHGA